VLSYLLAVLAACANATSSVLQRKANREVPRQENLSWKLVWSLVHEPVWFGGILAIIAGFLLQATALGNGQLAVVEPILVLELPATLILASRVFGTRMHRREWASIVVMTAGLAGLLYSLSPSAGRSAGQPWYGWVIGVAVNLAFAGVLVLLARRGPAGAGGGTGGSSARQAALLGVAGGSVFGLTAALMKGMTAAFSQGLGTLFTSWQLYGMIAAGLLGMFLVQSALNAGRLLAAQPGLTLSDPVVSILWGVTAFHEQLRGGLFLVLAIISGLILAAAVIVLARSPLLSDESRQSRPPDRGAGAGPRPAQGAAAGRPQTES
jgi:drug/metabolite transporter (DMT)-like permease